MKTVIINNKQIIILVVLGTIVRLVFGLYHKPWLFAPDQIAWQTALEEMVQANSFSYMQMIHAPHEGGSFLVSLIALAFRPLQGVLPSLVWAALVIDSCSRLIQLWLARKIFGETTALYFGIWTILSVPLILPWGTVNFGLHSLSAFFPFVFIYYAARHEDLLRSQVKVGLLCGLSLCFSYDNIVLIPAGLILTAMQTAPLKERIKAVLLFLLCVLIGFVPHILLRLFADNGFHLEHSSWYSVRNTSLQDGLSFKNIPVIARAFYNSLTAFLLNTRYSVIYTIVRLMIFAIGCWGLVLLVKRSANKIVKPGILICACFFLAYAFSPFAVSLTKDQNYVTYRHLAYIIPILSALILYGLVSNKKKLPALLLIVGYSCSSLLYAFNFNPYNNMTVKAAGWILVRQFGSSPKKLQRILQHSDSPGRNDMLFGYGWGYASTLLKERNITDTAVVDQLQNMIEQFPAEQRKLMIEGVAFAFSKPVTPVLDPQLKQVVLQRLR